MPTDVIAPNYYDIFLADMYYKTGEKTKAAAVLTKYADINVQEIRHIVRLSPEQRETLGDDYIRAVAIAQEIVRVMRGNRDMENARLYAEKYARELELVPLLSNISAKDLESKDFYKIFATLSDAEKQLVQTYLYLLSDEGI
jgi:hypothetical protein